MNASDKTLVDETRAIQSQKVVNFYKNRLGRFIFLLALFILITALGGYTLNWLWTGYPGNTLWDWLHLLLIPIGLTLATLFFSAGRAWKQEWTVALICMVLFLIVSALGGYLLHWTWTGFQGNALWDWFKLLLTPVGLSTLSIFFGVKRTWRREWIAALSAVVVLLLIAIAGGYLLHWTWTGFQGNTLWDWLKLLLLPVALGVASVSFKGYERVWTAIIVVVATCLLLTAIGGYFFHWTWTGFAGNTLWDWLELLLLPLSLAVAEPLFNTYRDEGVAVATIGGVFLLTAAIGGYAFHWTWTGFQNNTLWDWLTLLVLPLGLVAARISYYASQRPAISRAPSEQQLTGIPVSSYAPTEQDGAAVMLLQRPMSPVPSANRRRGLRIFTIAAVLLILLVSSLGTLVFARPANNPSRVENSMTGHGQIVGSATFFSTPAQFHQQAGINDGLQLQLQNIPAPSYGNLYYAWLQENQSKPATIALGTLTMHNGVASLSYVDPHHRDLLELMSNLLITEEAEHGISNSPTLDKQQWRYSGSFPQPSAPTSQSSFLSHIRHLLSNEPELEALGFDGGADRRFLNNIEPLQEETIIVRDHVTLSVVRQQIANILYYLDGKCAAQDLQDAQGTQSPGNALIAHDTSISLLNCTQGSGYVGLLADMQSHLLGITQSPGVTAEQVELVHQINDNLDTIHSWLEEIRAKALTLVVMNDTQLSQSHHLRADMANQAAVVVNGGIDPTTHVAVAGSPQIVSAMNRLAIFDITQYNKTSEMEG